MKGAWNLHYEKLSSKLILSLDATRLSLGGAGELEMELFMDRHMVPGREGDVQAVISVDGLIGGHSGKNAFSERGNANTLLVRMLSDLQRKKQVPFRIISFTGGDYTACALARDAACALSYPASCQQTVQDAVEEWQAIYSSELAVPDPDVRLSLRMAETLQNETCDDETTGRFTPVGSRLSATAGRGACAGSGPGSFSPPENTGGRRKTGCPHHPAPSRAGWRSCFQWPPPAGACSPAR